MKNLNKFTKQEYFTWTLLVIALIVIASGCSISGIDKQNEDITEEDLQAASRILGESLSDETSGVMGSLNDALTTISSDGFVRTSAAKSSGTITDDDDNSGRGREFNFTHSYDPETGTHTLAFQRKVTKPDFSKNVTDTLKYIFTDNNGAFIQTPRENRDRIETIDFKGFREGTIESPRRNSFFARNDTFFIAGVSQASEILTIEGVHNGRGNTQITTESGNQLERDYQLEINFLNIEITKAVVQQNQSLEQGVFGTLTYEMVIEKTRNGSSSGKTMRGTIEMSGDGTALLKFERFKKLFQINLDNGEVRDQDDEFEGNVSSVHLDRRAFTLANGRVVKMTDDTKIDPEGDLLTLEQVARALEAGHRVRADGEGFVDGDVFVATAVEFETDANNEADAIGFEAFIKDAHPDKGTILLQDERVVQITDGTEISSSGDYTTLPAVKEALEMGRLIIADGTGIRSSKEGINIVAKRIEFDEAERDVFHFEDLSIEVNLDFNTITLEDGRIVWVNEETEIDQSGDYITLGGVKEALAQGLKVRASGKAVETNKEGIDIIATRILFKKEEV